MNFLSFNTRYSLSDILSIDSCLIILPQNTSIRDVHERKVWRHCFHRKGTRLLWFKGKFLPPYRCLAHQTRFC